MSVVLKNDNINVFLNIDEKGISASNIFRKTNRNCMPVILSLLYLFEKKEMIIRKVNPERKSEKLDADTLMKDRTPGISLSSLLENPTEQGLPRADVKKGSINYWKPLTDNNSVAWFNANCGRAILNCNRYPSNQVSSLGVFRCIAR